MYKTIMNLPSTFFIDIDGCLVNHKGKLSQQFDSEIIENTIDLIDQIEKNSGKIILTTGRKESMRDATVKMLEKLNIFYDQLIMGLNRGPRILINDLKPNYHNKTAYAFTPERNNVDKLLIEKIVKPCEERPWGYFSTLAYSDKYHIKEIIVKPGCKSSLQSHDHREELWLVISGNGECICEESRKINKGDVVRIKQFEKHRVINDGDENLVFIEIQTGELFSENDITRHEDQFGRV